MIELRLNERLAAEPGSEFRLGRWGKRAEQDRFNHDLARQMQMAPAIDRAHSALRQFDGDLVIADDFADHMQTALVFPLRDNPIIPKDECSDLSALFPTIFASSR